MKHNKRNIAILLLVSTFIMTSGFGCKIVDSATKKAMEPIALNYWRVWDNEDDFGEIIKAYNKIHPNVTINYRKLRYEEYEDELLNALAEDRGPDIFSIHNTWVKKYLKKLTPLPPTIQMAYPVTRGTLKKQTIPELRTTNSLTIKELKNNFLDVVYQDVVNAKINETTNKPEEKIFALPLSVDTLVMYYNRDLLNNSGIIQPPAYWNKEFQLDVKKIARQNSQGEIIQAGVALGGSNNIERYSDILSVLMMQNGATMTRDDAVSFTAGQMSAGGEVYNPGLEAFRFYTDFANPAKEVYSWNKKLENSLTLFAQGKLAMMFGYAYHLPIIKAQAPKLNFSIAKLPQIEGNVPVNFANYWVEAVSNKSKHVNEAWDFIQFITRAEQAKIYCSTTKRPTALRSLINEQMQDMDLGAFAEQLLTAKSWYRGYDATTMEKIMAEMIDTAALDPEKLETSFNLSAQKIQQTYHVY